MSFVPRKLCVVTSYVLEFDRKTHRFLVLLSLVLLAVAHRCSFAICCGKEIKPSIQSSVR